MRTRLWIGAVLLTAASVALTGCASAPKGADLGDGQMKFVVVEATGGG